MVFLTPEQAVRLLAAFVFVSYRVFENVTKADLDEHEQRSVQLNVTPSPLGPTFMTIIWFMWYVAQTAFFYLFLESAVDYGHWSYLTTFIIFVCHVLVSKLWIGLFFKYQYYFGSFLVSFFLAASAWAIFGIAVFGGNVSAPRFQTGMAISIGLYGVWLLFPLAVSYKWYMAERIEAAQELRNVLLEDHQHKNKKPYNSKLPAVVRWYRA